MNASSYDQAPALVREAIDAELEPWLATKEPHIAEAWERKLTTPGHTRLIPVAHTRPSGRVDNRTMDVHLQVRHSSGVWLPAFMVRLRGAAVRDMIRALTVVVPDDVSSLTDDG